MIKIYQLEDYLKEIFPPSHLNENATLEQIQSKGYEENVECIEAQTDLIIAENNYLCFEKKQKLAHDLIQELNDSERMRIEEARKLIEIYNLSEHHELSFHIMKLENRKII